MVQSTKYEALTFVSPLRVKTIEYLLSSLYLNTFLPGYMGYSISILGRLGLFSNWTPACISIIKLMKAESSDPDVTAKLSRSELALRFLSSLSQAGFFGLALGEAVRRVPKVWGHWRHSRLLPTAV